VYLLLARFPDVPLGLEEGSDVQCLSPPKIPVDGPIEGEFEGAAVEGAVTRLAGCLSSSSCGTADRTRAWWAMAAQWFLKARVGQLRGSVLGC
jgi:hypothetical protein